MNNVTYSCPWPSLLETARVTAHNRRAHLTGSVCWSVTTTQNGQMPLPRVVDRHAQISTALTEFNQRFVIFGPPPGDLQCLNRRHWQRGHLSSDVSSGSGSVSSTLPFLRAHRPGWDAPPAPTPQRWIPVGPAQSPRRWTEPPSQVICKTLITL